MGERSGRRERESERYLGIKVLMTQVSFLGEEESLLIALPVRQAVEGEVNLLDFDCL